jgi:triosephosphate isomerase
MKKKRNIIIVGNWKMNPETQDEAKKIYTKINNTSGKAKKITVVVCPPAIYLSTLAKTSKKYVKLGAQDTSFEKSGSFTGSISPDMIRNAGADYVILGHSERRAEGELDETIAKKAKSALETGLKPIICVGEKIRDNHGEYLAVIKDQILKIFTNIDKKYISDCIVAYEPVWAIGKSFDNAMKPSDVHEMSLYVKKILSTIYSKEDAMRVPVLYGGSVNFENAQPILLDGEVSGLLVGRQSLDIVEFPKIIEYANKL